MGDKRRKRNDYEQDCAGKLGNYAVESFELPITTYTGSVLRHSVEESAALHFIVKILFSLR